MFRKALSILLVSSWVVLSAVDVLEDLNLGAFPKIHTAAKSGFPGFGQATKSANNAVENGSRHLVVAGAAVIAPTTAENVSLRPWDKEARTSQKKLKIYKLHKVFII